MSIEGAQLAQAMLSIHAADMEQAARHPEWRRSAYIERVIVLHQGRNRAVGQLASLWKRASQRLQHHGVPKPMPLRSSATSR
jgi:hypothetical protein